MFGQQQQWRHLYICVCFDLLCVQVAMLLSKHLPTFISISDDPSGVALNRTTICEFHRVRLCAPICSFRFVFVSYGFPFVPCCGWILDEDLFGGRWPRTSTRRQGFYHSRLQVLVESPFVLVAVCKRGTFYLRFTLLVPEGVGKGLVTVSCGLAAYVFPTGFDMFRTKGNIIGR